MSEEKALLRRQLRARRAALSPEELEAASRAVCARVASLPEWRTAKSVMAYAAARGEIDVGALLEMARSSGKALLLPHCEGPGAMTARRVTDLAALTPGAYGIAEPPQDSEICPPERIDFVLVPGVAFSRDGGRLGQGGGYYDRFLPRCGAFSVGVCHGFALLERLPQEEHDARVRAVASPLGVFRCGEESV